MSDTTLRSSPPVGVMKDYRSGDLAHLSVFSQQEIRQAQLDAIEDAARTAELYKSPVDSDWMEHGKIVAQIIRKLKEKV